MDDLGNLKAIFSRSSDAPLTEGSPSVLHNTILECSNIFKSNNSLATCHFHSLPTKQNSISENTTFACPPSMKMYGYHPCKPTMISEAHEGFSWV